MKKGLVTILICAALALASCGSKSDKSGGGSENGSGGNAATPAKSNVDSTLDSAKMPAHVDTAKK